MSVSRPVHPVSRIARSRAVSLRFGLLLAAGLTTGPAWSVPITTNAPIVVTASRANRPIEEIPAQIAVLTSENLRDSGAQDVVGALEKAGSGLYFRHNSDNPAQAVLSMRGFGDNSHGRVLVLVDGQRLNAADMANPDWLRIPLASVDRIEVLRGGQTALYGNFAVAGVVNIITRQPTGDPVTTLGATAGSDNTYAGHVGHAGSVGDTRYTAETDWRSSNGWRDNSAYENADVRATLAREWTEWFATVLSAFYSENACGLPGALTNKTMMVADPRQTLPANSRDGAATRTFGGSLGVDAQIGTDGRLSGAFAASRRTVAFDTFSWSSFSDTTLERFAFTPRYTLDTDLAGHRNQLLAGVDLETESLAIRNYYDSARAIRGADATLGRRNLGVYLQEQFWFTGEWALTVGGRYEICRYTSAIVTNLATGAANRGDKLYRQHAFDAGLLYRPNQQFRFFARVASLYRDPFLDELTDVYFKKAINGALLPETGQQYEIGASLSLAREWTADLALYRLDMEDEIAYDMVTWSNRNLQKTRRYGADATLTWARTGVGLVSVNYGTVDARFSDGVNEGKRIPLVPAHVVTLRGERNLPLDLAALATVRAVSNQYFGGDDGNRGARLATYGVLDLGLRYRPRQLSGLEIILTLDNVLDATYANFGYYGFGAGNYYYPSPGRTWRIGASYRF